MASSKQYVGKTFTHPTLVRVYVDSVVEGSKTKLNVTVVDRGKGWNEKTQSYKGWKNSIGWMRGENREYLKTDVVHKNDLK